MFVTGATGELGRLVIRALLNRVPASCIVAGVRSPEHAVAHEFSSQGVEIRVADYTRPDALEAAFSGIDRLLLISSSATGQRYAQHANVIDAAKVAGVAFIAYTSLLHANTSPLGIAEEHRQTEALLQASGLPAVVLRNGWYTENQIGFIPPALQYGAVLGSAGEGRFSTAARADYAEAAAVVLTTDGHAGRVYELAGDESYTLSDFAAAIAAASGKPVIYKNMPTAAFRDALLNMGLPEDVAELVSNADDGAANAALQEENRQLSALIGRPTISWRNLVETAVSAT